MLNILYDYNIDNKCDYDNYNHNYNCFITCHCLQYGEMALDLAKRRSYGMYIL